MTYQEITQYSSENYGSGRPEGPPTAIWIHHWGIDGQSFMNVVNYLCRTGGDTSAHYVAEAGQVACIVAPKNRAWHAGPVGNPRGIGIECRPEMRAGDFETVAELVANLRKTYGDLPLKGHKEIMATACPGRWYGQLEALDRRAREIQNGTGAAATASTKPAPEGPLTTDGVWGPGTTRALQRLNRLPQDGKVSSQDSHWRSQNPGLADGWEWVGDAKGSPLISAMQRAFGVPQDGLIGPGTIRGMQRYYGTVQDGRLDEGSSCIVAMQHAINRQAGAK